MASGPGAPTVYSVARTVSVSSGVRDPSGRTISAPVPAGNSTAAVRSPSSSLTGEASWTWGSGSSASMTVASSSNGVTTIVSSWVHWFGWVRARRCTVGWPSARTWMRRWASPLTTRSNRPSAWVRVEPSSGWSTTSTMAPGTGSPAGSVTWPRTAAARSGSMVSGPATSRWMGSGSAHRKRVSE